MLRDTSWEAIDEQLASVRRARPPLCPLVDALKPMLALVHREAQAAAVPEILVEPARDRSERGQPILPRGDFRVDVRAGGEVLWRLVAMAGAGETGEAALSLRERAADAKWVEGVLLAYASGDLDAPPSDGKGNRTQQLAFFAGLALRPQVEAAAASLGRWVSPAWAAAICPVCGTEPRLAELRAPEGRRFLHCGFCGWAWPFRRGGCPFCEGADHRGVERVAIEGDPRCKIEACPQCRRYLKLVDNHEAFGLLPFIEDLTTPHLELLAVARGYR